jgi:hypothetical protein
MDDKRVMVAIYINGFCGVTERALLEKCHTQSLLKFYTVSAIPVLFKRIRLLCTKERTNAEVARVTGYRMMGSEIIIIIIINVEFALRICISTLCLEGVRSLKGDVNFGFPHSGVK